MGSAEDKDRFPAVIHEFDLEVENVHRACSYRNETNKCVEWHYWGSLRS